MNGQYESYFDGGLLQLIGLYLLGFLVGCFWGVFGLIFGRSAAFCVDVAGV